MTELYHTTEQAPKKESIRKTIIREMKEWIRSLLWVAVITGLIVTFIATPVRVKGSSMLDTLQDNDFMIVTKFEYILGSPRRFDVVTCHYPNRGSTSFVKRIVGIPGDMVAIHEGRLYVNGEAVKEPYITRLPNYEMEPVTVKEGCYFVLGDNRPVSNDSHSVGQLTRDQITGKVRFVAWPIWQMRVVE